MPRYKLSDRVKSNLRRGLRLHEEGKSGDGLKPATVRAARDGIERGWDRAKLDKAVAWFARHRSSRTAGDDKRGEERPAFVAWLLWGGDPESIEATRDRARRAEGVDAQAHGPSLSETMTDQSPFRLDASAPTVLMYGPVGSPDGIDQRATIEAIEAAGDGDLLVRINSAGGDAFAGIAVANALRQRGGRTVVRVDGLAASAASMIAMGADHIQMAAGALMMIHDVGTLTGGNAAEHKKSAETLEKLSGEAAKLYARRSGRTVDEMRAAMRAETWYTAEEAVEAGLADEVLAAPMDQERAAAMTAELARCAHVPGRVAALAASAYRGTGLIAATPETAALVRRELGLPADGDSNNHDPSAGHQTEGEPVSTTTDITAEAHAELQARYDGATAELAQLKAEAKQYKAELAQLKAERPALEAQVAELSGRVDAMHEAERTRTRDALLDQAAAEGRITAAAREQFAALYDAAPGACVAALASLPASGAVPTKRLPGDAPQESRPVELRTQRGYLAKINELVKSGEAADTFAAASLIEQQYPGTRDAVMPAARKGA